MRIVSLLPSATEIVLALGLADSLVGVTFECDYPPDPRVGRSIVVGGLDTHGLDAVGIDALVRSKVSAGELLYQLDAERFRVLGPDVVLTQDLCRVCALPSGEVDRAMDSLGCSAQVLTLDPHTLDEVIATIAEVGAACAAETAAVALVASLQQRLDRVRQSLAGRTRRRVFVLEWPDPPFVAGHWVPELVSVAGGEPVLSRAGQRSVETSWDEVAQVQPEVVIVSSCGFDLSTSSQHARELLHRLPDHCEVWAIDGNGLVVRPGPRLVDGVETIAAMLHEPSAVNPTNAVRIR
jgi:iron complex transport system substrate-binding protein